MKQVLIVSCLLFLTACAGLRKSSSVPLIREGSSEIIARAAVPFPSEVVDETQASILACQGATALNQAALLDRLLKKKAASGKPLAQAEIPHIDVQNRVRTLVKSAQVTQTLVRDKTCAVTLVIFKSDLRPILKDAK